MTEPELIASYRRRGYTVLRGPFTGSPFPGCIRRCAILRRGFETSVLTMDDGLETGRFPIRMTRIKEPTCPALSS